MNLRPPSGRRLSPSRRRPPNKETRPGQVGRPRDPRRARLPWRVDGRRLVRRGRAATRTNLVRLDAAGRQQLDNVVGESPDGQASGKATAPAYRPSNFLLLATLVVVLNVIGLVMVLSASSVEALRQYGSAWMFFERQLMWVAIGGVVLLGAARVDYRAFRKLSVPLLSLSLLLLLAVLVPKIGVQVSGSSRWVGFGEFRLQPSELMKFAMVLFGAEVLSRRCERFDWPDVVRPVAIVFAVAAILIMKQPDMGTTLILACTGLAMLFAVGTPIRRMCGLLGLLAAGGLLLGVAEPYRRARLLSFINPFAHASGSGYQVVQSLVGLGRGHLIGVGLGASRAKWGFLPNAHTDFIFAIIGEELGLIGSLLVVGLFAALAFLGVRVAVRAPDRFGGLLAIGITCWIVSQAVINIGAVIGILPVTGVPLPFVSYGGSSLVIVMAAAGVLLNIASQDRRAPAAEARGDATRDARTTQEEPPARRAGTLRVTRLPGTKPGGARRAGLSARG